MIQSVLCSFAVARSIPILRGDAVGETDLDDPAIEHWASPLAYAVVHGPLDMVSEFARVDEWREVVCKIVDGPHRYEATALQLAVMGSRDEACRILLENGADYRRVGADRSSQMHQAVSQRSTRTVEVLARYACLLVNAPDLMGLTPLHLAAGIGSYVLCQVLVEHGAQLSARGPKNNNIFHFVMLAYLERNADLELIRYLARLEPRLLNEPNEMGHTPIDLAATSDDPRLYELLATHGVEEAACLLLTRNVSGERPPEAPRSNNPMSRLAPRRDVNSRYANGDTPLLRAASLGQVHVCSVLLRTGADPLLIRADSGKSALHLAAERRHAKVVGLLVQIPELLEHRDHEGNTALIVAASLNDEAIVEILLGAGARVDVRGAGDKSAIHWAARFRNARLVAKLMKVFLAYDKEPGEVPEVSGSQPEPVVAPINLDFAELLEAIRENDFPTLEALAKNKEIINARRPSGDTPLLFAASCGNKRACEILLKNEADPMLVMPGSGRSALHVAVQHRRANVVELLAGNEELLELADSDGNTPLLFASYLGYEAESIALLNAGANLAARGKFNRNALHWAAFHGNAPIIEQIVNVFLAYVNDKPPPADVGSLSFAEQGQLGVAFSKWVNDRPAAGALSSKVQKIFEHLVKEDADLLGAIDINKQRPDQLANPYRAQHSLAALHSARVKLYIAVKRKFNGVNTWGQ